MPPALKPRHPRESETVMSELMMPNHANIMGNVFGGVILSLVDRIAAVCAIRHARKECVTVSVDKVDFREPIHVGELITAFARVNYAGKTSMGAVIGAALAAGVPFDDVRRRALGLTRRDIAPFNPFAMLAGMFARALIPASALRRTIARLVPVKGFAGLKIPLTVTATDLDSGELVLFPTPETRHSATDLHDALYASC